MTERILFLGPREPGLAFRKIPPFCLHASVPMKVLNNLNPSQNHAVVVCNKETIKKNYVNLPKTNNVPTVIPPHVTKKIWKICFKKAFFMSLKLLRCVNYYITPIISVLFVFSFQKLFYALWMHAAKLLSLNGSYSFSFTVNLSSIF